MNGLACLREGFALIRKPGIRRYVIIPTVINIVVLAAFVAFSVKEFERWVASITNMLPDWLSFLSWAIYLVGLIVVAFLLLYSFMIVANLIASPFNAVLSSRIEETLTPGHVHPESGLYSMIVCAVAREISKLLYVLPRLLILMLLSIIPLLNTLAPLLWVLFGGWMVAIQYCDYGADNNQVSFRVLRERMALHKLSAVSFGVPINIMLAIPLVNLFLLPIAVAGGTVFWVRNLRG